MTESEYPQEEFSFKRYFVPLTTAKAITWLIIIGLVVFVNMLFNGFVWDDTNYLLANAEVHSINVPYYFGQTLFNGAGQYRAFSELYFSLLYSFSGISSFFYHFVQLVIHIVNTIFVFILFKKFFKTVIAFPLALIFLVHPMQVESVSYISAAASVLFFLFGIVSLFLLGKKIISLRRTLIIFLLLLSSLLSKEAGIQFVIIGVVYIWLFNRKNLIKIIYISVSVIIIYSLIRFGIGQVYFGTRPLIPVDRLNMIQRFMTLPQVMFYYFKTFVFPGNLFIDQQWVVTEITFSNFYVPLITMISLVLVSIAYYINLARHKSSESKIFLFFCIWTLVGFVLYSQIFPLDMTVADRWMYFPIVGILGMIGSFVSPLLINKKSKEILLAVFILAIILFSSRTIIRNMDWNTAITLYAHDTKLYTNYLIENDYAQQLNTVGDVKDAFVHQERSVTLFPYEQNLLNLADLYSQIGNNSEAEHYYILALQSKSYIPWKYKHIINTYIDYAKLLLLEGNSKKAVIITNEGIQDYSDFQDRAYLLYLLALADYKLGNLEGAKNAAQQTYTLLPIQTTADLYDQLKKDQRINVQSYLGIIST